jgi:putative DNA primase/helicase
MPVTHSLSIEQQAALQHARHLAENGVPIFLARPDLDSTGTWNPAGGQGSTGYLIPKGWEKTVADVSVIDEWKPGWAICAVMGHATALLDMDPKNGGEASLAAMGTAGQIPTSYGHQSTPSGGLHYFTSTLGVSSRDGLMPGIDIKDGKADGSGRGFGFIAPTQKLSKATGEIGEYEWLVAPDLSQLTLVGPDGSEARLKELIELVRNPGYDGPDYEGDSYAELGSAERAQADRFVESRIKYWKTLLTGAADWPEGETDERGRGWEALSKDCAWSLATLAAWPWTGVDDLRAEDLYEEIVPEVVRANPRCAGKFYEGLVAKACGRPVEPPPWAGAEEWELAAANAAAEGFDDDQERSDGEISSVASLPALPKYLDDARLVAWIAKYGLKGDWRYAGGMGWLSWDGRKWRMRREEDAREAVRLVSIEINRRSVGSASADRLKQVYQLLTSGRIGALTSLIKGVVSADPGDFDSKPDLLNVGNGVVDLRTSELLPHDRGLLLTKITETPYVVGATHPDWDTCLDSMTEEVAEWMQARIGQGVTGYMTSDDVLPICQGGGANGKSTFLAGLYGALGDHVVKVPDKLLQARPSDHPTELMTLFGARLAVIDETPEIATLSVPRLKAVLGQQQITARLVHKDNVTWSATHSLLVMTNYVPMVAETDKGTWRRLALIRWAKTFVRNDRFRADMELGTDGRREAALGWVIEGSRRWYEAGRVIPAAPESVEADTLAWRADHDLVLGYIGERLVFDPEWSITAVDLLEDVNVWLVEHNLKPWGDRLVSTRFGGHELVSEHGVYKHNPRSPGKVDRLDKARVGSARPKLWKGVRFRWSEDELI